MQIGDGTRYRIVATVRIETPDEEPACIVEESAFVGLLDRGFEEVGFCVVRGPALIWCGDARRFYAPAGRFDGEAGGHPGQDFSKAERSSGAVAPAWWVVGECAGGERHDGRVVA